MTEHAAYRDARSPHELASLLPKVDPDASKYSRGTALVVGGSARYTGAPVMAAMACARTGAGYTSVLVPGGAAQVARNHLLSIPVAASGDVGDARLDQRAVKPILAMKHLDSLTLGPGMEACDGTAALCTRILREVAAPIAADADALNCISGLHLPEGEREGNPVLEALQARTAATVLTPHDGELARLAAAAGISAEGLHGNDAEARCRVASQLAVATGCIVVAKGRQTAIADGETVVVSQTATPALAKAGTGDVLAGMLGSLLAQGLPPMDAAELAVCLHGLAGRLAESRLGVLSVMAEDVIEHIPEAITTLGV